MTVGIWCAIFGRHIRELFNMPDPNSPLSAPSTPASPPQEHQHVWRQVIERDGSFISYDMNPPLYAFACECGERKLAHSSDFASSPQEQER